MDEYLEFGQRLIDENPRSRTICGELAGRRVWIKKPVPPKARIWHHLQKLLAGILRQPIMRSTVSPGGGGALHLEAARLSQFKAQGFHVPDVLAVSDDMLVLSDAGPQLRVQLDELKGSPARLDLLKEAIIALARVHKSNMVHGRPYMRDMTWDGEKIGFLDLEENPLRVMSLRSGQARDVWIFLSACCRYAKLPGPMPAYNEEPILKLFREYEAHASAQALNELKSFVAFLQPLQKFLQKNFWLKIGTDARQSVFANYCLALALLSPPQG